VRQANAAAIRSARIAQASAIEAASEPAGVLPLPAAPERLPAPAGYVMPAPVFAETDRPAPAMKTCCDRSFRCFNCGEDDPRQCCNRNCRKKCGQTWYPRVAPYCQTGWGWTQPCWRRTQDTRNCPPVEAPTSVPVPVPVLEVPAMEDLGTDDQAAEPLPAVPPQPHQSASRR
jgi:hypothetical protein